MIKALLTSILLCTMAITVMAQPVVAPPTVKSKGLHGPVKTVMSSQIIEIENAEGGAPTICMSESWLFDSKGHLTDYMSMSEDGINIGMSYRYDAQGRLVSANYWGGDATREEKYIYDKDKRLLRIEVTFDDETKRIYRVTGSDSQKRTTSIIDTLYGKRKYKYTYDDDGQLKTSTCTFLDSPTTTYFGPYGIDSIVSENEISTNQYNENGDIVLGTWKNFSLNDEHRYSYTYDPDWRDQYGNWRWRQITLIDGTKFVENRQIIYYE